MFGSKFSNKCKHYAKIINSRIVLIRKKKQATVKFLKHDVAQLLRDGHDDVAFGRMDALICEINHTSCYDMIEEYCQFILKNISSLQKQRECPDEAAEAVSTLIDAASRFSDLPELCDLRRVFAERYGNHMEAFVSTAFAEKVQKKSFSSDKKLQLMQDIADELSVSWDSKAFQQKDVPKRQSESNVRRSISEMNDQRKRQSESTVRRSLTDMNGRSTVVNAIKEAAVYDIACPVYSVKKETIYDNAGPVYDRKEIINQGDAIFFDKKAMVFNASGAVNRRKEAVSNAADVAINKKKAVVNADDVVVNGKKEAAFLKDGGGDQQIPLKERGWEATPRRSLEQKQVRPEPRDIHVVGNNNSNGRSDDPAEKTRKLSAFTEKTEIGELGYDRTTPHPTPKGSKGENRSNEGTANNWYRSPIIQEDLGLIGIEKQFAAAGGGPLISNNVKSVNLAPPPYTILKGSRNRNDVIEGRAGMYHELQTNHTVEKTDYDEGGASYRKSKGSQKDYWLNEGGPSSNSRLPIIIDQEGPGSRFGLEKQQSTGPSSIPSDEQQAASKVTPCYTKFRGGRNGSDVELQMDEGLYPARPIHTMMPPPYTKSKVRNPPPSLDDDTKVSDNLPPVSSSNTADHERPRPVSVKQRLPIPPSTTETDSPIYDAKQIVNRSSTPRTKERFAEEVLDRNQEIAAAEDLNGGISCHNHRRVSSTTSSGRRKHGGRGGNALTYDGDCDEEEEEEEEEVVMDRLLHLSKKKDELSTSRRRTRTTRPPRLLDAADRNYNGRSHFDFGTRDAVGQHRPERVASLLTQGRRSPPPTVVGDGYGKGPVRTTSLQPELLSPNGGFSYRIPDYDVLAARFIALRKA